MPSHGTQNFAPLPRPRPRAIGSRIKGFTPLKLIVYNSLDVPLMPQGKPTAEKKSDGFYSEKANEKNGVPLNRKNRFSQKKQIK